MRTSLTDKFLFGNPTPTEQEMIFPTDVGLMDSKNQVGEFYMRLVNMPYVERCSIFNAVPPFAEIGKKLKKYMA